VASLANAKHRVPLRERRYVVYGADSAHEFGNALGSYTVLRVCCVVAELVTRAL